MGLLLPPSVAGVAANAALALDRRIAVNLNYTVTAEVLNECIRQCGIRHVLTSRRVLERFPLKIDAQLVCLEDLQGAGRPWATSWPGCWPPGSCPPGVLERWLGLPRVRPDDRSR